MPQPTEVHQLSAPYLNRTGIRLLISRFRLSVVCYLGVGITGMLFSVGDFNDALSGLLVLVVLLLVVAVRNTWDLMVTIADRPDAGRNRRRASADVEKDLADG